MEQNTNTEMPMPTMANDKQRSGNGLKITALIACVLAVCGIGFGIYGMMQVSDKDGQVVNLKAQIEKLETAEKAEKTEESAIIEIDTDNGGVKSTFSANILTNIKKLGDSRYGFKSYNSGNGIIYEYIDSNGNLILEKDKKYTVASDVVFADFLWEGNGGMPSLYFVKDDGSVGVVKNVAYDTENPVPEEVTTTSNAVFVKNITTQDGHEVVIVDSNGNFIDL